MAEKPEISGIGAAFAACLLAWYRAEARDLPWRHNPTPYRVWVSEIMLQQTRVEAVKRYFARFMDTLGDIPALAAAPEEQLLKLWEGLGYYSRARNLQKAAKIVLAEHGGALPGDYDALMKLPGIGEYTAGAIASIAFSLPCPAVDGNVLRVLARLQNDKRDIADPKTKRAAQAMLRSVIPPDAPGDFNQALMELGATVCVPNGPPLCGDCPVRTHCAACRAGTQLALPVKAAKRARRIEERTVLLLECGGRFAVRKRRERGLLHGLWELPALDGRESSAQALAAVKDWGLAPVRIRPLADAKHIFTHIEWHMSGFRVSVEEAHETPLHLIWASAQELREEYALPSAFGAYLKELFG